MPDNILRRPEVEFRTGLSRSTIYDYLKQGIFPRPIPLGPRARGWLASEIDAWLERRTAERNDALNCGNKIVKSRDSFTADGGWR